MGIDKGDKIKGSGTNRLDTAIKLTTALIRNFRGYCWDSRLIHLSKTRAKKSFQVSRRQARGLPAFSLPINVESDQSALL